MNAKLEIWREDGMWAWRVVLPSGTVVDHGREANGELAHKQGWDTLVETWQESGQN